MFGFSSAQPPVNRDRRRELLAHRGDAARVVQIDRISTQLGETQMMKRGTFVRGVGLVAASSLSPAVARAGAFALPPTGFSSNNNYFIYGGGKPIRGLRVTINVDEDIVAPQGMSMQLNCNSPANANCAYQQYVTNFDPNKWSTLGVVWIMENFPSQPSRWHLHNTIGFPCNAKKPNEQTCSGNLFNYPSFPRTPFARFPVPSNRLPAGFKIIYELIDDANGAIIGTKFTVVDKRGREKSTGPHLIHRFKYAGMQRLVGPEGVAPILAFQMNLVGLGSGLHATLNSGAGRITYEATTTLTAEGSIAALTNVYQGTQGTSETSNLVYSPLPAAPNRRIVQRFSLPFAGAAGIGSGGPSCPTGQTYNSLDKKCEIGRGRIITNDKAPPRPPR
jgi:hypothetical protein